jgi:tetratricopeptide (TPR) repeat protein
MSEKQLAFKDDEIIKILNYVYNLFKEGRFADSIERLEQALKIDFEYPGVTASLKCANFWIDKQAKLKGVEDRQERGEYLMLQWKHFSSFVKRIGDVSEKCLYSIRQYIFKTALEFYKSIYEESGVYDTDILMHMGRCYKGIGNYEKAIEYLEIASQQKSGAPIVLAELADCYSLINEVRASKAFYREAFFLNPQEIDLSNIESAAMNRLIAKLKEKGFTEPELSEWIPVYATIFGVFNVKRELRPIEFGQLKQRIFKFENDVKENKEKKAFLVPRLINHYFWLIDHYINTGEEKAKIDEVLLKIKSLDPVVYKEYTQ